MQQGMPCAAHSAAEAEVLQEPHTSVYQVPSTEQERSATAGALVHALLPAAAAAVLVLQLLELSSDSWKPLAAASSAVARRMLQLQMPRR